MSATTVDTVFRALTTAAAILGAASPLLVAVVVHYLRRSERRTDEDGQPAETVAGPSVSDAATVQGMTFRLYEAERVEHAETRERLERVEDALLRAEARGHVLEAERDLARGALTARDLPVPTLQLPGQPPHDGG